MWFTLPKNKKLASIDIEGNTKIYSSPTLDGLIGSVYLDRENNLWVSQLSFKGLEREILRSDECGITIPACIFRFGKVTG